MGLSPGTLLTLAAFWGLLGLTVLRRGRCAALLSRSLPEWLLDLGGLAVQGWLIPVALVAPIVAVCARVWPNLHGALSLPSWLAFGLAFVGVDYLYYWNHRLLHTPALWPVHQVHHTAPAMDVLVTSRNTLWTSVLIVYLWSNAAMAFLLKDPGPYFLGAATTAALDLARHAPIDLSRWPRLERALGLLLVLPRDHALHHADLPRHGNYGANLVLWDRWHGTYLGPLPVPPRLGVDSGLGTVRSLLWPFPSRARRPRSPHDTEASPLPPGTTAAR